MEFSVSKPEIRYYPASPQENEEWMKLCRDPQWNYQPPEVVTAEAEETEADKEEGKEENEDHKDDDDNNESNNKFPLYYYCKDWKWREGSTSEFDDGHEVIAEIPEMDQIHAGALAPKFVFENDRVQTECNDDHSWYMKRFMCFLCKRFVILSRPSEGTSLDESCGMPQVGARYWWRYWDNYKNVYQVPFTKFRDSAGTTITSSSMDNIESKSSMNPYPTYKDLEDATRYHGMPPGEFTPPDDAPMWMRVIEEQEEDHDNSGGGGEKEVTDHSSFFDHMWSFTYHDTTRVALWDANLLLLQGLAGVPPTKRCRSCWNHLPKMLQRCGRCKLVYYCKHGPCQKDDWKDHKKMCNYFK